MTNDHETMVRLEGMVRGQSYDPGTLGKPFLGTALECDDGVVWVLDYHEQSPYHAFRDRRVVVLGEPFVPDVRTGQFLAGWRGDRAPRHIRVATVRLVDVTPEARFVEVGRKHELTGRFKRDPGAIGESALLFVADEGEVFVVANDPAGAIIGTTMEVEAYRMQPSPAMPASRRFLWIICPYGGPELWAWRRRHS